MKKLVPNLTLILALTAMTMSAAHAQNLSTAEKQKMVENVIQADGNSDGNLNRSEFEMLINLNAADNLGKASKVKRAGLYDKAFNRLDADGNGLITKEEMEAMAANR